MSGSLLRLPGFRWLWLGQTLLFGGVQFWIVAVTWLMLQRTGSGTSMALVLMAAALPRGRLMLLGGVLSDRHPPRTLAVQAGWILAIATGVLTLLAGRDALALGPVLVLAAVFGAAEACVYPAAVALLPRLLEARRLGHTGGDQERDRGGSRRRQGSRLPSDAGIHRHRAKFRCDVVST